MEDLEKQLTAAKAELKAATEKAATLEGTNKTLTEKVATLEASNKSLGEQVATLLSEKEGLADANAKLKDVLNDQNSLIDDLSTGKKSGTNHISVTSSAKKKYQVNPKRRFSGIPGFNDRTFTGADLKDTSIKVKLGDKMVTLVDYLEATNASILKPSNG